MSSSPIRRFSIALAALGLLATAGGCDAPAKATPSAPGIPPAAQSIQVRVDPSARTVAPGASIAFTATVTGTSNGRVTWSLDPAGGGTLDATGLFTASANPGPYRVRATSVVDSNAYGDAAVTIQAPLAISVSVAPTSGSVYGCQTLQLTATVQNATNPAVTWSVQEAGGGTVDATGLYHAPAVTGSSTFHVVATSAQDGTKSTTVPVTVSEHVLSVTVSPATLTLAPGQTAQFSATVTTTCGATTTVSSVTAPQATVIP